jgi:hypothetical protein
LLRQKKVTKEKASRSRRPLRCATGYAALLGLGGVPLELGLRPQTNVGARIRGMTFILVAANADQIIQVSDRRLSSGADAKLETDDFGKAGHLLCDDASALYGFTGLATYASFNTSAWLMDAFSEASKRDSCFRGLIEHFAVLATEKFKTDRRILSLAPESRRLTVMLTAYTASGHINNALISNFQDFLNPKDHPTALTDFSVFCEISSTTISDSENPTFIQAIGAFRALLDPKTGEDIPEVQEIRDLLERRAPYKAILGKVEDVVTTVADKPRAMDTVGKRLNTGRIDSRDPLQATAGYISDVTESTIHLLNCVDGRSGSQGLQIRDMQITTTESIVFPKVAKNAPCSCGSGKKYKLCHGSKRW